MRRLAVLALLAVLAAPAAAEVRIVEALGALPLDETAPRRVAPREAALALGLREAVHQVALEELLDPDAEEALPAIERALGAEPLAYANRFRILEDRGERPALFTSAAGVEKEYVVRVEAHVDVDRVREHLRAAGLAVTPSGEGTRQRIRVILEDVRSYGAYQAVRTLLLELGARAAVPVELERGRAVLDVEADRGPEALLEALLQAAPPELRIVPLESEPGTLRLRARFVAAEAPPAAPAAFDTPDSKRY